MKDLADQALKMFKEAFSQTSQSILNKAGQLLVVVEQAKIVCTHTIPGKQINTLMVAEPRSIVEGRRLANIQDVKTNVNIKPWPCKCKLRPSGKDYLPCDYKPTGMWTPGIKTETSDAASPQSKAPSSKAGQIGYEDGLAHGQSGLKNIANSPATQAALQRASEATGIPLNDLTTVSIIESSGNAAVGTNAFGYTGLMQMGPAAAQDVGVSFSSLVGAANVSNNALAGAKYLSLSSSWLNSGIAPTPLHMYMAHQQGAGGTNTMMRTLATNPGAAATRNQLNNVPGHLKSALGNLTQQDFYDYWAGKVSAVEQTVAEASQAAAGSRLGVPVTAMLRCSYGGTIAILDPGQRSKFANPGGCIGLK